MFLHMMKRELSAFCIGAKIDKIYLPSRYEIVFALRSRTGAKKLFISAGSNAPRVNFTSYSPENPAKPPMLCMLFRKLLTGALITDIRQQGLDRILFIDMNASNEIGDRVKRTLAIEIMAQYSNCILLDENGVIIDALKRVDLSKSSFREVLPQLPYRLPPAQDKLNLLTCSWEEISGALGALAELPLSKALLSLLSGVSPMLSRELAYRVSLGDPKVGEMGQTQTERLKKELEELRDLLLNGEARACYVTDPAGEMRDFSFLPLTQYANDYQRHFCASLSELLDVFYVEREKTLRARAQAEGLFRTVSSLVERTAKKVNVRREELPDDAEIEEKRICAELINVYLSSLPKGVSEYELPNYYDENRPKKIRAYPELSPQKNAQKYYKEYKKAQTARKVLAEQIETGCRELEYLQTVQDELSRAESFSELSEIREELRQTGFIKSGPAGKQKKEKSLPPLCFAAPNGFRVLVGRNNIQNDTLSLKTAKKTDLWFHVQKAPGSHVVLCLDGAESTPEACEFAAGLAVWFSSVRDRGKAEVDYTQVKNLKKPPAANPGYVIYHVYKTIYAQAVRPKESTEVI